MKNREQSLEEWAKEQLDKGENAALVMLVKSACEGRIRVRDALIAGEAIVKAESQEKQGQAE